MPGIIGLISKMPRAVAEPQLRQMVETQLHEPFYTSGTWIDESLGVYVGWTAQQNSFCDGMPLTNERGDVSLVFSGEEYSQPGIGERLRQQGHTLTAQDSAYLVHLYESDPNFVVRLNGMFHGLIADRTRGTITLFNDRYGMHRIYYHEGKDAFYFAAEAKAILAVCPELRTMDPRGLGEFVACSCVLENRTIFKGIHALPGGSSWTFQNSSIREKATYFLPSEWEEQDLLEPEPFYRELRDIFSRNLPMYFNGHQRVGMTLTGGLDTRVIMAWHKPAAKSLPCYTFGGMFRDCEDVRLARRLANVCQQTHEVLTVGNDFLSHFPHYAERSVYLTEGGVDVYRASDLYVSERARELAPVKIVGTDGSEIIRQAVMFKAVAPRPELYRPDFVPWVEQAKATYLGLRRQHPVTFAAFRQSPWYHHGILSLEQTQLTVRSPYLDNDFVRTIFRAPQSLKGGRDVRLRLISDGDAALARIRSDRGVIGEPGLSSAITRGLLEFTFKAEYAYDYGMPQWVAKIDNAFAPLHLERLFLGRHKFSHYRLWYRRALADYVRQILLDPRTLSRPYLQRTAVEAVVEGHTKGGWNYTTEIHKLLTLELMQRLFLDSKTSVS
jgi:asparagine synthase (glutamine-hydrolysing)